jgi:hypothetical protein
MINETGTAISKRLAQIGVCFIVFMALAFLVWPRLGHRKARVAEIPITTFRPPEPPTKPFFQPVIHTPPTPAASPTPQAKPTPCQPCIEAANEVLTRYLHAIRDGAGTQEPNERNIYEIPKLYTDETHPVYVPHVSGYDAPHP